MLQSVRSLRRPVFALVLLAALVVLGAPGTSGAVTRSGHDFTYYSDSTHSTVVGYRYYCIGYSGGWGAITPYSVMNNYPCING